MTSLSNKSRSTLDLTPPNEDKNILLHSCCAPCSGELMEAMLHAGISVSIYFYNPNIHPKAEYELRKQENKEFATKHNISFVDGDYDTDNWFERAKGLEDAPERGERCTMCFDLRFERTALYAKENGFNTFTSSMGVSRWKDMTQVNQSGEKAAAHYDGITYWAYNWRKKGGADRMVKIAKANNMYKQEYCGCVYSLRDTNKWRKESDKKAITFGREFY